MKPGAGGGILVRETTDKKTGAKGYAGATGTVGYRWMESEMVKVLEKQDLIDRSYYDRMVDEAVETISKYGDFERFAADDSSEQNDPPPWATEEDPHYGSTPFDVR